MKHTVVLIAVLLVAAAITATVAAVAEEQGGQKLAAEQKVKEASREEAMIFSLYDSPRLVRDYSHPRGKLSTIRSLYDKPFFATIRMGTEMFAFLLMDGLSSLTSMGPTLDATAATVPVSVQVLRDALFSSNRVGIMLNAVRMLGLPEMAMPIVKIVPPKNLTMEDVYRVSQDHQDLPWMYMAKPEDLPAGVLDKLVQVGQFAVSDDKLAIAHDFTPAAIAPSSSLRGNVLEPTTCHHERMRSAFPEEIVHHVHPAVAIQQYRPIVLRRVYTISA